MKNKIISIFCLIDDMLKMSGHKEDVRRRVSDSEILTIAIVSAMCFHGHHAHDRAYGERR